MKRADSRKNSIEWMNQSRKESRNFLERNQTIKPYEKPNTFVKIMAKPRCATKKEGLANNQSILTTGIFETP